MYIETSYKLLWYVCGHFRDVYSRKKLELDRAEANIADFISTTFNSVSFLTITVFSLVVAGAALITYVRK